MSIPHGLETFIEHLKTAEVTLKDYRERHEKLLNDCQKDNDYDSLEDLPGLSCFQIYLENSLDKIGFQRKHDCKCKGKCK